MAAWTGSNTMEILKHQKLNELTGDYKFEPFEPQQLSEALKSRTAIEDRSWVNIQTLLFRKAIDVITNEDAPKIVKDMITKGNRNHDKLIVRTEVMNMDSVPYVTAKLILNSGYDFVTLCRARIDKTGFDSVQTLIDGERKQPLHQSLSWKRIEKDADTSFEQPGVTFSS